jgi:nucleotide-binding universal stress UspA family protein
MPKRVLVPVDGSPHSRRALEFAVDEWPDARIVLLYVVDPVDARSTRGFLPAENEAWVREAKADGRDLIDDYRSSIPGGTPADSRVEVGRPADTIVDVAGEDDVDHVVMGSHGRKGVRRVLLGSVTESVARNATVPVTIVR